MEASVIIGEDTGPIIPAPALAYRRATGARPRPKRARAALAVSTRLRESVRAGWALGVVRPVPLPTRPHGKLRGLKGTTAVAQGSVLIAALPVDTPRNAEPRPPTDRPIKRPKAPRRPRIDLGRLVRLA